MLSHSLRAHLFQQLRCSSTAKLRQDRTVALPMPARTLTRTAKPNGEPRVEIQSLFKHPFGLRHAEVVWLQAHVGATLNVVVDLCDANETHHHQAACNDARNGKDDDRGSLVLPQQVVDAGLANKC